MKILALFLSVLCLIQLGNATKDNRGPAMIDFTKSLNVYTADLYNVIKKRTADSENIFFSPLSIAETLGMLLAGAHGNTHAEIVRALRINTANDYTQTNYNKLFRKVYNKVFNMTKLHTQSKALLANRAFVQVNYPVKSKYVDDLKEYFDAGVDSVDFGNADSAADMINSWVGEKTNDMITDLMDSDSIDALTRLVLVNALYFQANWKTKFLTEGYGERNFSTPDGTISVPFMGSHENIKYRKDEYSTQVLLPYDDDEAHMLIAMPYEESVKDFYTYGNLKKFFTNYLAPDDKSFKDITDFRMPLFELDQTLDIIEMLKQMNVRDLFDQQKADLSGISEEDLHVGMFTHKAKITVNERGTKAAAATAAVIAGRSAAPPQIVIDKPFLFAIYRRYQILFVGRVCHPLAPVAPNQAAPDAPIDIN